MTDESYRMQPLQLHYKIKYINDSRCTNVNTAWFSLSQCNGPTIWVVGGMVHPSVRLREKLQEPEMLEQYKKLKAVIVLANPLSPKTEWDVLVNHSPILIHVTKDTLMPYVKKMAEHGDTVLFSPAAASFDMFENFEQRGSWFTQQVSACS